MVSVLAECMRRIVPFSNYSFLPTARVDSIGKAVVVIGCDTGLGRAVALRLLDHGYAVLATCLNEQGAASIRAEAENTAGEDEANIQAQQQRGRLFTFCMDITDEARVNEVVDQVRDALSLHSLMLHAVVHVAGAMMGGPIAWTDSSVFRKEIELNYLGLLAVMKGFLHMLLHSRDEDVRFVVVTSEIGLMPSFPGLGGYTASKHAAEALVNNFRIEMRPFGLSVHTICPGITATPFLGQTEKQMSAAWSSAPESIRRLYGAEYFEWWAKMTQFAVNWLAQSPNDAITCIEHATSARWPKQRYHAGLESRFVGRFVVHAPDNLWDLGMRTLFKAAGEPSLPPRSRL